MNALELLIASLEAPTHRPTITSLSFALSNKSIHLANTKNSSHATLFENTFYTRIVIYEEKSKIKEN